MSFFTQILGFALCISLALTLNFVLGVALADTGDQSSLLLKSASELRHHYWTEHIDSKVQLYQTLANYKSCLAEARRLSGTWSTKHFSATHLWKEYQANALPAPASKVMEEALSYRKYLVEFAGEPTVKQIDEDCSSPLDLNRKDIGDFGRKPSAKQIWVKQQQP